MALAASIGAVFAPWFDRFSQPAERILLILVTSLGLYGVFRVARWLYLKTWRYRRLLGRWYYTTHEHAGVRFIDRNVAMMDFILCGDGDIAYSVHLYPNIDALCDAEDKKPARSGDRPRGSARSLAVAYDKDQGSVDLLFEVIYATGRPEDLDRLGMLNLQFRPDETLTGQYLSQVNEHGAAGPARGLSSGHMFATRDRDRLRTYMAEAGEPPRN